MQIHITIPKEDVYKINENIYFKYTFNYAPKTVKAQAKDDANHRTKPTVIQQRDIPIDMKNWDRTVLLAFAKYLKIKKFSTMKKPELYEALNGKIIFA